MRRPGSLTAAILAIAICCGFLPPVSGLCPVQGGGPCDAPGGGSSAGPVSLHYYGAPEEGRKSVSSRILINEVLYDPAGSEVEGEFIELYNTGPLAASLCGWSLSDRDGGGPDITFPDVLLPAGAFLVIRTCAGVDDADFSDGTGSLHIGAGTSIWTNTGDDALLCDTSGAGVDYVAFGCGTYVDPPPPGVLWCGPSPSAPEGRSISRLPDGSDSDSGADWFASIPTPGAPNRNGEWAQVAVNELMPWPTRDWNGDGKTGPGDEWVELFNPSATETVELTGYSLDDAQGGSRPFVLQEGTGIPPLAHLVLFGGLTHVGLNDEGDLVRLFDPSGREVDNISYSGSAPDVSIGRIPDGDGPATNLTFPTPGETNILDNPPEVVTVRHLPREPAGNQTVTVLAVVRDDFGVVSVELFYSIDRGTENYSGMVFSGEDWAGEIPGQAAGSVVRYRVRATDTRNQTSLFSSDNEYVVCAPSPLPLSLRASLSASRCKPGETVTISGCVMFETDAPAAGASVRATGRDGELVGSAVTDSLGTYTLSFRAPGQSGNHTIKLTAELGDCRASLELILVVVPEMDAPSAVEEPEPRPEPQTPERSLRLTASLNCTEALVTRPVILSGRVETGSGAPAGGAIVTLSIATQPLQNLPAAGVWCTTADADGIYMLEFPAPDEAGVYTFCVTCTFDALFNSTALQLRVKDSLRVTLRLSRNEARPFALILATGLVLRSTGAGAPGASLHLTLIGREVAPRGYRDLASADGSFNLSFRAPGRPGRYMVELEVNHSGLVALARTGLEVDEPLPPSLPPLALAIPVSIAAAIPVAFIIHRCLKLRWAGH